MLDYADSSTYSRPDPKLVEQWRRKLSKGELALLEARMGALLRLRGYAESGVSAARVGYFRRGLLSIHDRLARFRFRLGRYGLWLMIQSRAAELLGLAGLRKQVALARNEIDNRFIK